MAVLKDVLDIIGKAEVLPDMSGFDPDQTFRANGIDSLDVMNVFLAVEEHYQIKFSEEEVETINTASELLNVLNSKGVNG